MSGRRLAVMLAALVAALVFPALSNMFLGAGRIDAMLIGEWCIVFAAVYCVQPQRPRRTIGPQRRGVRHARV